MTKLTLSVKDDVVRQAKHLAVDRGTTVSELMSEGLERSKDDYLHTLAQLSLRAWHHFPDATPFIMPAILAFRDVGIEVLPQRTGFQLLRNGRRYIVEHHRVGGRQIIRIRPRAAEELVATIDLTDLEEMVRRAKASADYSAAIRPIWRAAIKIRDHADKR